MVLNRAVIGDFSIFVKGFELESDIPRRIHATLDGEIGLSRYMIFRGHVLKALWCCESLPACSGKNPHMLRWKTLIERGLPMIKRKIVRGEFPANQVEANQGHWPVVVKNAGISWPFDDLFADVVK